jgi:hypothetical protein
MPDNSLECAIGRLSAKLDIVHETQIAHAAAVAAKIEVIQSGLEELKIARAEDKARLSGMKLAWTLIIGAASAVWALAAGFLDVRRLFTS